MHTFPIAFWGSAAPSGPGGAYFAGGANSGSGDTYDTIERYDFALNTMAPIVATLAADKDGAAGLSNLVEGIIACGTTFIAVDSAEKLTFATETVSPIVSAASPIPDAALGGDSNGATGMLAGGTGIDAIRLYDHATEVWSLSVATLSIPGSPFAVGDGAKAIIPNGNTNPTADVYTYATDTLATGSSFLRYNGNAPYDYAAASSKAYGAVWGGSDGMGPIGLVGCVDSIECYDFATDTTRFAQDSLAIPLGVPSAYSWGCGGCGNGATGVITGGTDADGTVDTDTTELYDFSTYTRAASAATLSIAKFYMASFCSPPGALVPTIATFPLATQEGLQFSSVAQLQDSGPNSDFSTPTPALSIPGLLMILCVAYDNEGSSQVPSTRTITPPLGWTLIRRDNVDNPISGTSLVTYWKFSEVGEPAGGTVTSNFDSETIASSINSCTCYGGVDPVTPIDGSAGATGIATDVLVVPSVTTTNTKSRIVAIGTSVNAFVARVSFPAPQMYTRRQDEGNNTIGVADEFIPAAGAVGTRQIDFAGGPSVAIAGQVIALRRIS